MKKILTVTAFLFLFSIAVFPSQTFAAPPCTGNSAGTGSNDPACYTTYSYDIEHNRNVWVPGSCSWYLDCRNCSYPCGDGSGRACRANFYTNTKSGCPYSRWCDNMGSPPGRGYWDTQTWTTSHTGYSCHYISSVDSWSACNASNQQYATAVTWSTRSGTGCGNEPTQRYCCPTPSSDVKVNGASGSATVDAEDNFNVDWSFTNTDSGNGYNCKMTHSGYDVNIATPLSLSTPTFGLNTGSRTGRIDFAGPNPSFTHAYTINCTNPIATCPSTSDTTNVSVTPLPITATITALPNPAEVVDTVRWSVTSISGGVPFPGGDYKIDWDGAVEADGMFNDPSVRQVDAKHGIVGTVTADLTVEDRWGTTKTFSKSITVQDTRQPQ